MDKNPVLDFKTLTASKVLLFLGGVITVLAGIIYITINWGGWSAGARILAIFIPEVIVLWLGVYLYYKEKYQRIGVTFLTTASLLFPLFLTIFIRELNLVDQPSRGLIISSLTLTLYLVFNFIFTYPIWPLLYSAAGLFVLFFFIDYYQIRILGTNTLYWAFLILNFIYLMLALLYEQNQKAEHGKYQLLLGWMVSLFAFLYLMVSRPLDSVLTWYLLIPSYIYFIAGYYFEAQGLRVNFKYLYSIGSIALFLTILKLGLGGKFIDPFGIEFPDRYYLTGSSLVIAGLIYLATAELLNRMRNFGGQQLTTLYPFFEAAGTFATLGGIFYLGLGGEKLIFELLLLAASLGFIFLSIPRLSRSFLYVGTIFLVVFIFDIGAEYFQNQVGWPITLFISGIASMLIGLGIEKLRQGIFNKPG